MRQQKGGGSRVRGILEHQFIIIDIDFRFHVLQVLIKGGRSDSSATPLQQHSRWSDRVLGAHLDEGLQACMISYEGGREVLALLELPLLPCRALRQTDVVPKGVFPLLQAVGQHGSPRRHGPLVLGSRWKQALRRRVNRKRKGGFLQMPKHPFEHRPKAQSVHNRCRDVRRGQRRRIFATGVAGIAQGQSVKAAEILHPAILVKRAVLLVVELLAHVAGEEVAQRISGGELALFYRDLQQGSLPRFAEEEAKHNLEGDGDLSGALAGHFNRHGKTSVVEQ
mmetsp:Transcript_6063/g.23554  ORF Transcript_6063/g.23554 Transcript_6063/m.23554 type:complete len:280 (+) Transcript_6063:539-1378(+)